MDWTKVVYRIEGADDEHRGQGTGFACAREGGAVFVVTCWHVVRQIGPAHLHIQGLPCELVSEEGDDDLDLAVLRVPGLSCEEPLTSASGGIPDLVFQTYGYEPVGRALSGTLGARLSRPHVSKRDVSAWDYYLREGSRALEKIKDGYSGAPVFDARTQTVVAVITHRQGTDKGFAIDIANLPRVYPAAAAWSVELGAVAPELEEPADEYGAEVDAPLAKLLDHADQLAPIRRLLADAAGDREIALVEACSEDWPSYLADHIHLQPWPDEASDLPEAVPLRLTRFDGEAFWQALIDELPRARHVAEEADKRTAVRDWINGARLRVFYVDVPLERHGRRLPEIVRGARATLAGLGDFAFGTQVLVLFACVRARAKPPFWWPLYTRFRLSRLDCCRPVDAMRLLDKADVESWYVGFPSPLHARYDRDRLKAELLDLFAPDERGIRYERARRLLVDDGALRRARIKT